MGCGCVRLGLHRHQACVSLSLQRRWGATLSVLLDSLLGPPGLRGWLWGRAACAALSTVLFAVAAQSLPIMDLVAIVYLAREWPASLLHPRQPTVP